MKTSKASNFAQINTALAVLAFAAGTLAAQPAANPRLVALSGTQAPGQPAGVNFDFFSDPRVNVGGQIAFWAELAGPGITPENAGGIWMEAPGGPTLLYRAGDPSPAAGLRFAAIPTFALSPEGHIAFTASLIDPSVPPHPTRLGMFADAAQTPGTTVAVAIENDPIVGLPAGNWAGLPLPPIAANDGVGVSAFASNNGAGIWQYSGGGAVELQHAAGQQPPGSTLAFAHLDAPILQASGAEAGSFIFRSTLAEVGAPVPPEPVSSGLYISTSTGIQTIATAGDAAPGMAGATFAEFAAVPSINEGTLAFWARIDGAAVPEDNTGIWVRDGALSLLAGAGQQAPDTDPGQLFASFGRQVAMSTGADVAFTAYLNGTGVDETNNSGIWVSRAGGAPSLLAREGDQAPRMPLGTEFATFGPVFMNEAGQIAFTCYLRGSAVTPADNFALYATDRRGRLIVIARKGDVIDAGGNPETIAEIIFDSSAPGAGQSQFVSESPKLPTGGRGMLLYKTRFVTTPPAVLQGLYAASIRCLVDLDNSQGINVDDFMTFINAYAAQDFRRADIDGNGLLNVDDFTAFINAFLAGCH